MVSNYNKGWLQKALIIELKGRLFRKGPRLLHKLPITFRNYDQVILLFDRTCDLYSM